MTHQCISIGASSLQDLIKYELSRELQVLSKDGIQISLQEDSLNRFTFLDCRVSNIGPIRSYINYQLAHIITNLILDKWQDELLKKIIKENYYYFDEDEKVTIYDYARQKLCLNVKTMEKFRLLILQKLTEYLDTNNYLVLDGFIRFRLKEYMSQLYNATDQAVDDYLMEREYKEFIELLRYFVEVQDPRVDLVNVVLRSDGVFNLFDKDNKPVDSDYLRDFMIDLVENEINYEDLLISALITIAPKEIIFHPGNGEFPANTINTISKVFVGRVSECEGCSLCAKN